MSRKSGRTVVQLAKFYPPELGGIEVVTKDLAEGFAAEGFFSRVVAFTSGRPSHERHNGVAISRCYAGIKIKSQPISLRWLWEAVKLSVKADTLLIHYPNILAAFALLVVRRPYIVTYWHSDLVNKGLSAKVVQPLEYYILRRSSRILVTSDQYAAGSERLNSFSEKVIVVPIGIHDPSVKPRGLLPPNLVKFLKGRGFALSVGRLVPYKGFDQLVETARYLPFDCPIVIVGTGPQGCELRARIDALDLHDQVFVAGRVEDDVLRALFAEASLYVMSSVERSEAFGIVQVEAMAYSLPIVTTNIQGSGVPWVGAYGALGALVPVRDPQALAQAIKAVMRSASRMELGGKSRQRFEAAFTARAMIAKVVSVIGCCASLR